MDSNNNRPHHASPAPVADLDAYRAARTPQDRSAVIEEPYRLLRADLGEAHELLDSAARAQGYRSPAAMFRAHSAEALAAKTDAEPVPEAEP